MNGNDMINEGSPIHVIPESPPMRQHVCSLKMDVPQTIPKNTWTVVKFPYDSEESYDPGDMHPLVQGGIEEPYPNSSRSGLVYPAHDGPFARLDWMVQWENDYASEYKDQLCRDPFGIADTTATSHRTPSPGMQCFVGSWDIFVHPDVPLSLRVAHNHTSSLRIVLAEFKISYWWYA